MFIAEGVGIYQQDIYFLKIYIYILSSLDKTTQEGKLQYFI